MFIIKRLPTLICYAFQNESPTRHWQSDVAAVGDDYDDYDDGEHADGDDVDDDGCVADVMTAQVD